MIGTVRAGRQRGIGGVVAAAGALAAGLAAGSLATFAAVAAAGTAVAPGRVWPVAASVACLGAAAADCAGLRVRPQIRSQVPERWRRTMPLPLATLLYGLLLGSGATGAVPAFAAWGLMLFEAALGNLTLALAVGGALALGRVLPVVCAVAIDSLECRLTERPGPLRAVRAVAAVALAVAAAGVVATSAAGAVVVLRATDPSTSGADLSWEDPALGGVLERNGARQRLPGHDPAIGGHLVAWHHGSTVTVARRDTMLPVFQEPVVGVRQLAVSDEWLVLRQLGPGRRTRIIAQSIADTSVRKVVATVYTPATVGRPAIAGATVVFAGSDRHSSWITAVDLRSGGSRRVRESTTDQFAGPSLVGLTLLYVDISRCDQILRLGSLRGRTGRPLLTLPPLASADNGHERGHTSQGSATPCGRRVAAARAMLWTTALSPTNAYVTELTLPLSGAPRPSLLRLAR